MGGKKRMSDGSPGKGDMDMSALQDRGPYTNPEVPGLLEIDDEFDSRMRQCFEMYDIDEGGTLNTYEEMRQLTTNIVYTLNAEVPPDVTLPMIAQYKPTELPSGEIVEPLAADPWEYERFVVWFCKKVMDAHYEYE